MVKLTDQIVYIRTKTTPDNVKKLNLWGCEIDDIDLCEKMVNVEILSLSVNKVTTLAPLRNCRKLRELYLRKNLIESLTELEHLRHLKELRVLWIDENPCTIANDYRHKVVRLFPSLTKLDDRPVSLDDQCQPTDCSEMEYGRREDSVHSSTLTIVNNPSYCGRSGAAIIDTILPSQFLNYGGPTSSETSEEEAHLRRETSLPSSITQSMHPLMTQSMMAGHAGSQSAMQVMAQSMYQPATQMEEKDDDWGDFSLEDDSFASHRPLSMDGIAPRLSFYDSGSRTLRPSSSSNFGRSASAPRRRFRTRTESTSPARKILSAVSVLMDELDPNGLRMVVDEAQRRLKKER